MRRIEPKSNGVDQDKTIQVNEKKWTEIKPTSKQVKGVDWDYTDKLKKKKKNCLRQNLQVNK